MRRGRAQVAAATRSLLDRVAEFAQALDVRGASAGDDRQDPVPAQLVAVGVGAVALVAEQGLWTSAGTTGATGHRWDAVDKARVPGGVSTSARNRTPAQEAAVAGQCRCGGRTG